MNMIRVVINKSDGKVVYRSEPPFEDGLGIANALVLYGGAPDDYAEVEISEQEWEQALAKQEAESLRSIATKKLLRAQTDGEKLDILIEYLGLRNAQVTEAATLRDKNK